VCSSDLPNVQNSGATSTWAVKNGRYVKIGQQVTCWLTNDGGNSGGGGGVLSIQSLPFPITNLVDNCQMGIWGANSLSSSNGGILYNGGDALIYVGGNTVGGTATYIGGCFTYRTD
jgi:hypothetical protein